jgi:hypothetical protein
MNEIGDRSLGAGFFGRPSVRMSARLRRGQGPGAFIRRVTAPRVIASL